MVKKIKKFIFRFYPILVTLFFFLIIFKPIWFNGLIPFPGDLLVTWYFPYKEGGWLDYSSWITRKDFILADVIRQIYPWRVLAIDLFKQGLLPLWNIFSFAGTPLMANLQSSVFYPINILFFFLPNQLAWLGYILLQPIMATLFMYLFIRSCNLSKIAALIAGLGFAFFGYVMVWFEMGIIGHTALYLPLILWALQRFSQTSKSFYLGFIALGIFFSILAGHAQTAVYCILMATLYLLVILFPKLKNKARWQSLLALFLGILLASIQILPTLELMIYSARDSTNSAETFFNYIIPWSHLAMLLAPDFFGNPAAGNFWGKDYAEFMSYSGIVILLFAVIGFYVYHDKKIIRFYLLTAIIATLIAFYEPMARFLFSLKIPVLSTGIPSRTIFVLSVSIILLASYGVEAVYKLKLKKIIIPLSLILGLYFFVWLLVFKLEITPDNLSVTKRNLILPTGIIFMAISAIIFLKKFPKLAILGWLTILLVMSIEYGYFMNKYLPWSKISYVFPEHKFLIELSNISKNSRVHGSYWAGIGTNLAVQWRLQTTEGYDPLHLRRYSEFVKGVAEGKLIKTLPRSDVMLIDDLYKADTYNKRLMLNLLGIEYVLDSASIPYSKWDLRQDSFPPVQYKLIYQKERWKVYRNKKVLPRAAIFYDYHIIKDDEKIITTLSNPKYPYRRNLILEKEIDLPKHKQVILPVKFARYEANMIVLKGKSQYSGLLFLSDNYYPGWQAFVNGKPTEILRANYTFRAVIIPAGEYQVVFKYIPFSFYFGATLSFVALLGLFFLVTKHNSLN